MTKDTGLYRRPVCGHKTQQTGIPPSMNSHSDDVARDTPLRHAELDDADSTFLLYANPELVSTYDRCPWVFSGPLDPRSLLFPSHKWALFLSHSPQRLPALLTDSQ